LREFHIQALVDRRENFAVNELFDYQARSDTELFRKLLHCDSFADSDFTIDRRRRNRFAALGRRTELPVELAFHVPLAIDIARRTGLALMPAARFNRRRRWLDPAERRSRMAHRTPAAHLRRAGRRRSRSGTAR